MSKLGPLRALIIFFQLKPTCLYSSSASINSSSSVSRGTSLIMVPPEVQPNKLEPGVGLCGEMAAKAVETSAPELNFSLRCGGCLNFQSLL